MEQQILDRLLRLERIVKDLVLPETHVAAEHDPVTLTAAADANLLSLAGQEIGLDNQVHSTVFAGPVIGAPAAPAFRMLEWTDLPNYNYYVHGVFSMAGMADNVATSVFTITTVNEGGSTDGGGYICFMRAFAGHNALNNSTAVVSRYWAGHFSRAERDTGVGTNSGVTEEYDSALAATDILARSIDGIVVTVTETSEYVQTVKFAVDLSGSSIGTAEVVVEVTVLYYGFLTAPVIAAV